MLFLVSFYLPTSFKISYIAYLCSSNFWPQSPRGVKTRRCNQTPSLQTKPISSENNTRFHTKAAGQTSKRARRPARLQKYAPRTRIRRNAKALAGVRRLNKTLFSKVGHRVNLILSLKQCLNPPSQWLSEALMRANGSVYSVTSLAKAPKV